METPRKTKLEPSDADVIFLSAAKKKEGVINIPSKEPSPSPKKAPASPNITSRALSPKPSIPPPDEDIGLRSSALRRGIIKIDPVTGKVSPLKSSPGRSGAHYDFDRIARRKAMMTANAKFNPLDKDLEDLSDDEVAFAEKIIRESLTETPPKRTPSPSKKLLNLYSNSKNNNYFESADGEAFTETPVPSPIEEKKIIKRYGRSNNLLQSAQTLFSDGPEGYFEQHKFKGKPSGNTMAEVPQLSYEDFSQLFRLSDLLYYNERTTLKNNYRKMFTQFYFELSQGFNLCFYGVGSKRRILQQFVDSFLLNVIECPVMVVNGYNPATSMRAVITQLINLLVPQKKTTRGKTKQAVKFPNTPQEAVPLLIRYMEKQKDQSLKLVVLIHNIDGEFLKSERAQVLLAQIASLKQVWIVTSVDHINAPLLWDSAKALLFNFAYHDITTYDSYFVENGFRDVLSVGRSSKHAGAKGAKYVLSSLTQNARNLYRILVSSQLQALEDDMDPKMDRSKLVGSVKNGIEFKQLYNLCMEEFIATNEFTFRIMLREFIEHEMADISRKSSGTEIVFVPLTVEELEQLLMDELLE